MGDNSLRNMLYGWARFGLYVLINIFGVAMGKLVILNVVGTFIPRLQLYDRPVLLSIITFLIPAAMLVCLMADDAKRHTAYGRYNPTLVAIIIILSSAVYYIPSLVIDHVESKAGQLAITNMYFSFYWLSEFDDSLEVYSLIGLVLLAVICIAAYIIARKIYFKKFEAGEYEYEFK